MSCFCTFWSPIVEERYDASHNYDEGFQCMGIYGACMHACIMSMNIHDPG